MFFSTSDYLFFPPFPSSCTTFHTCNFSVLADLGFGGLHLRAVHNHSWTSRYVMESLSVLWSWHFTRWRLSHQRVLDWDHWCCQWSDLHCWHRRDLPYRFNHSRTRADTSCYRLRSYSAGIPQLVFHFRSSVCRRTIFDFFRGPRARRPSYVQSYQCSRIIQGWCSFWWRDFADTRHK